MSCCPDPQRDPICGLPRKMVIQPFFIPVNSSMCVQHAALLLCKPGSACVALTGCLTTKGLMLAHSWSPLTTFTGLQAHLKTSLHTRASYSPHRIISEYMNSLSFHSTTRQPAHISQSYRGLCDIRCCCVDLSLQPRGLAHGGTR